MKAVWPLLLLATCFTTGGALVAWGLRGLISDRVGRDAEMRHGRDLGDAIQRARRAGDDRALALDKEATDLRTEAAMLREQLTATRQELEQLRTMPAAPAPPPAIEAAPAVKSLPAARADEFDDLEAIRGIGKRLRLLLNQRGITTYRQIAHWTSADAERFQIEHPRFRGRIRLERWAPLARELHSRKYGAEP